MNIQKRTCAKTFQGLEGVSLLQMKSITVTPGFGRVLADDRMLSAPGSAKFSSRQFLFFLVG